MKLTDNKKAHSSLATEGFNVINTGILTMSNLAQITVPFHNNELYVVEFEGQPFTPMKPIVEGMGLDWASQFTKLKQRFGKGIVEITIPSKGGLQSMICLMLRKLPAWLYSIQSGKVKPEIRDAVLMYQNECDDVLWDYWTKGQAINLRAAISPEQQALLHEIVSRRSNGERKIFAEMWSRHNRHFKIPRYSELLAIHFPESVHYLETMALKAKSEKFSENVIDRLENFVSSLASRYPALQNPIAHEIAEKIAHEMQFQNIKERLVYWVVLDGGNVIVQSLSNHYAPVNIVKLANGFTELHGYMIGEGLIDQANNLRKLD